MASNHEHKLYKLRIEAKTSLVKRISSFGQTKRAIPSFCVIDQACSVKMAVYWPRSFLHLN